VLTYQRMLFDWVTNEPGLTGGVILLVGIVSGFFGWRMARFLITVYAGIAGYVAALALTPLLQQQPPSGLVGLVAAGVAGLIALGAPRPAMVVLSGALWGVVAAYLATQLGQHGVFVWLPAGMGAMLGTVFGLLCRRTTPLVITTLFGAGLIVVGFVGLANEVLPDVGSTFGGWAQGRSFMIPLLLLMLSVTAYSFQLKERQGEISTGAQAESNREVGRSTTPRPAARN
jgi:MFS family permease